MVFNITSTASKGRSRSGAAIVDILVAAAVASMVLAAVGLLVVFGARSFAAMTNYVILDQRSRNTLDRMSREIRQCNRLLSSSTSHLEFEDADGGTLRYEYFSDTKRLVRSKDGVADSAPLLEGCSFLSFNIYQRNPKQGVYRPIPDRRSGHLQAGPVELGLCPPHPWRAEHRERPISQSRHSKTVDT
ncbi:MAG: PilW family protein [Verrucomicrobiia bacterium]